jgi:hypothetical protein
MKNVFSLFILMIMVVSCKDSAEQVAETVNTQSEIESQNQVEAENANLNSKALIMEKDLAARHKFYQGVKGRFEGKFKTKDTEFKIRVTLVPNVAPYPFAPDRPFRSLEEIATDLNDLSFSAQVIQWNPSNSLAAVSCRVDAIKPDLRLGEITISNSNCPNLYMIKIVSDENETFGNETTSADLAEDLMNGSIDKVNLLVGEIQPSSNSEIYKFKASR